MARQKINQSQAAGTTLGYAQITSAFTSTTTPGYVDVTGLSVTVTVPPGGRNVKITAYCGDLRSSGSVGNGVSLAIRESSTVLNAGSYAITNTNYPQVLNVVAYVSAPSSGSHTYKVSAAQSGAGTLSVGANTGAAGQPGPAFILVELI